MSLKEQLRRQAYNLRNAQQEKLQISETICSKVVEEKKYLAATTVMLYLHCRSEVRTQWLIDDAFERNKKVVIPYCTKDSAGLNALGLWNLENFSELVEGTWGILEPPNDRWYEQEKVVDPNELDLIVVPGVAFASNGARLGHGAGYYDRLLQAVRPHTTLLGICYENQIFLELPMESHDIYMDLVLTEKSFYVGKGRGQFD